MNLEGLRYAQAVSRTKSFSAAARAYGVTQPALSNGIARLEEQLGLRLFDRSPRGVAPTAEGAAILPLIDRALSAVDSISAEARRLAEPAPGTIRIGVSPLIGPDLVARAFGAARALDPPRGLVLREANLDDLRRELEAGELDLMLAPAVAPMPRFQHRVIDREAVVVVAPEPAASAEPLELAAAAGASYILVPDACGLTTFTVELFREHDLPLRTYPGQASSYRVLEEWAGMGLGAALLPASKLALEHASCRPLVRAGSPVQIAYESVWRRDVPLGADLDRLVADLAGETGETGETH